ncbi:MAG: ABC transporter permease [Desulfurococcaceae archaeon]
MKIVISKRKRPIRGGKGTISALSVVLGILLFTLILSIVGGDFVKSITLIISSFTSPAIIMDMLVLTMLGYALLLSFKASIWNVGAEGQFFIGTIPVVYLLIVVFRDPPILPGALILVAIVFAALLSGLWGALVGVIKAYTGLDEVPLALILNYVAYHIIDYLVYNPFRGKSVYGYARTDELPNSYLLNVRWTPGSPPTYVPPDIPGGDFNLLNVLMLWGYELANTLIRWIYMLVYQIVFYAYLLVAAILIAIIVWFILSKTTIGLKLKITGSNPDFLIASGVSLKRYQVLAMFISGAFVGVVGALFLLSYSRRLSYPIEVQTSGYGYLAILVTWLSALDPRFVPLAAYIVSSLRNAGIYLQIAGLGGIEQTLLIIGTVLLSYSVLSFLSDYEVRVIKQ